MGYCDDSECELPAAHKGHYHAGPDLGGGLRMMWPMVAAPPFVKDLGRIKGYVPIPTVIDPEVWEEDSDGVIRQRKNRV